MVATARRILSCESPPMPDSVGVPRGLWLMLEETPFTLFCYGEKRVKGVSQRSPEPGQPSQQSTGLFKKKTERERQGPLLCPGMAQRSTWKQGPCGSPSLNPAPFTAYPSAEPLCSFLRSKHNWQCCVRDLGSQTSEKCLLPSKTFLTGRTNG